LIDAAWNLESIDKMRGGAVVPGKELNLPPNVKWLSLQEASRMLGVHPSTLRQWADAGKIHTVRTPGGHRRFAETDVRALLEPEVLEPSAVHLSVFGSRGKARLEVSGGELGEQTWYQKLDETGKAEYRDLGRKLLPMVMQYLSQPADQPTILEEARSLARNFCQRSLLGKLNLVEAVTLFLYLQNFLLDGVVKAMDNLDQNTGTDVVPACVQVNLFVKETLVDVLQTYG
jgi:excisionase family DNA binding protein